MILVHNKFFGPFEEIKVFIQETCSCLEIPVYQRKSSLSKYEDN
uniref:Uncharacterized protein n=1 Tax=Lepeophtheirus salmonis TaxID=72036 RepID=A0A0K2T518_LEPSM